MSAGKECIECGWIGDDPELRRELDKVDCRMALYVVVEACPECAGEELVDCTLCTDCAAGGVEVRATHDDYCEDCARANFDGEDLESFRRDAVQPVKALIKGEV